MNGEAHLCTVAPRFELAALLRVLLHHGYTWETISFEGVRAMSEAPGLISALRFDGQAPRRAIVRLNLGLLAPSGTLPSYFHRFAEEHSDPRPFLAFIRFFDDVLLHNHAWLTCPAEGIAARPALETAYRVKAGFASAPRLHWLFRAIVPELPVEVVPHAFVGEGMDAGVRFGPGRLDGTAVLGPVYQTVEEGFVVRLFAEEETDERGRSWEEILRRRCRERIVPTLGRMRRPVEVRVRFDSYRTAALLGSQMGTRPIRTAQPDPWEVVVASSS